MDARAVGLNVVVLEDAGRAAQGTCRQQLRGTASAPSTLSLASVSVHIGACPRLREQPANLAIVDLVEVSIPEADGIQAGRDVQKYCVIGLAVNESRGLIRCHGRGGDDVVGTGLSRGAD